MTERDEGARAAAAGAGAQAGPAALLFAGILLIALNLRASIVSVGPLLIDIQSDTRLPATALGLLVTLPLLGFGAGSAFASRLSRRFGIEPLLLASMFTLAAGIVIRSMPGLASLFGGTIVLGLSIAIGSVLVPALIRRDYPHRVGPMTSLFVTTFASFGAIGVALSVPLEQWLGWRGSLGFWSLPALAAFFVWIPLARRSLASARAGGAARGETVAETAATIGTDATLATRTAHGTAMGEPPVNVWRSPLAWSVSVFMGLQSLTFYVLVTWMPSVMREAGISAQSTGWLTFVFQVSGLAGSITSPWLVARVKDQRGYAMGASLMMLAGVFLLLWFTDWPGSVIVLGIGCGGSLGTAIVLFSARSANATDTGALSGMAQSVGYLLAATGPVLIGLLRDSTDNWTPALITLAVVIVVQTIAGSSAGAPRFVRPSPRSRQA